jgi:hypothetical protein
VKRISNGADRFTSSVARVSSSNNNSSSNYRMPPVAKPRRKAYIFGLLLLLIYYYTIQLPTLIKERERERQTKYLHAGTSTDTKNVKESILVLNKAISTFSSA